MIVHSSNKLIMNPQKTFIASLTGTIIVALCCFTPILVTILGVIGLGAVVGYLDYILIPALVVMLILTIISYRHYRCHQQKR